MSVAPDPIELRQRRLAGMPLTDVGNSARLVLEHGNELRHAPGIGWLTWDGARWRRDDAGQVVEFMKATVQSMREQAARQGEHGEELWKHANRSEGRTRIEAAIKLAESDPRFVVRADDLDTNPFALTVRNGTVDLRTGTLRDHDPGDLITRMAGARYEPDAPAPAWGRFLARVLPDDDVREFVQRAVGYTLVGDAREHVAMIAHGGGANGKTTFTETLRRVLGDYAAVLPAASLLERRGADTPTNDLAQLPGVRFVIASETTAGRRLNEERVKAITGGEAISARFLFREFFTFRPAFTIWLATNHKPLVSGGDAIWRRLRLIPFTITIPQAEQDGELPNRLAAEADGILAWAVAGARQWQADGLGTPAVVVAATDEYREDTDTLGAFLAERCTITPDARAPASELYAAYHAWCERGGEKPASQTSFGLELAERGYARERDKRRRWWCGVGLDPNAG